MPSKRHCLIAIGANLPSVMGPPHVTLRAALGILHAEPNISITAISSFWRNPAFPAGAGPDFCNAAIKVITTRAPDAVMALLHHIESEMGRSRGDAARWAPRPLDMDLIAVDALVLPDPAGHAAWRDLPAARQTVETPDRLILPHPRLQDRAFVLAPLAEIAPLWRHPVTGRTIAGMLADLGPDAMRDLHRIGPGGAAQVSPDAARQATG